MEFGPAVERDACGIGFVADANGRASREIVDCLLEGLHNVRHRGATAADRKNVTKDPGRLTTRVLIA